MNDCLNCGNALYRNGAAGPCFGCTDFNKWEAPQVAAPAPIERALATQVGGSHYKDMAIQPFEYIHRNGIGFAEGCAIKYLSRWRAKGGVEDLRKARHFIDMLIEVEIAP